MNGYEPIYGYRCEGDPGTKDPPPQEPPGPDKGTIPVPAPKPPKPPDDDDEQ